MNHHVSTLHLASRPYQFKSPYGAADYVLLIAILDSSISSEERAKLSRDIVDSGCRYSLAYGHECSLWDDSIDIAYIDAGEDPKRFIMTTWHNDEPIEDVVDFWWLNTSFDDYIPENFVILILGEDSETEQRLLERVTFHQSRRAEQGAAANP